MQPIRLLLACAVVIASASGCGSAQPSKPVQKPMSADRFTAEANRICGAANAALERIAGNVTKNPTKAQVRQFLATTVVVLENQIEDLDRLVPPPSLQSGMDDMLASARAGTAQLRDQGLKVIREGRDVFKEANRKSRALGLDACAQ